MPASTTTPLTRCCQYHAEGRAEQLTDLADTTLLLRQAIQKHAPDHQHDVRALDVMARCLSEAALRERMAARATRRQRCEP